MTVQVTRSKAEALRELCRVAYNQNSIIIRDLAKLVGSLVACEPGVLYAPIFYKRLEIAKNNALNVNYG
jgi:hypothetical protein